jgi:cold shock CspA family protein
MAPKDKTLSCVSCGVRFLDTTFQQGQRAEQGTTAGPMSCPGCVVLDRLMLRRRGTVRWYDAHRGYGFVRDEMGDDVFVHASSLAQRGLRLKKGQVVEFGLEQAERGLQARDLMPVEPQAAPGQ